MSFDTNIKAEFPYRDRYCQPGLATGSNDGTTPANAWQSIATANGAVAPGDRVWVKDGVTTTLAGALTLTSGTKAKPIAWISYHAALGDGSLTVQSTIATNGNTFRFGANVLFMNFAVTWASNAADTIDPSVDNILAINCSFTNSGTATVMAVAGAAFVNCVLQNTHATGTVQECFTLCGVFIGCRMRTIGAACANVTISTSEGCLLFGCILDQDNDNVASKHNISVASHTAAASSLLALHCTLFNGSAGMSTAGAATMDGGNILMASIMYDLTNGMIDAGAMDVGNYADDLASGAIVTLNYSSFGDEGTIWRTPVALSGNPFTASGSHDFTLNNTAGAGAACRDVCCIGNIFGAAGEFVLDGWDLGAVQAGRGVRDGTDELTVGTSSEIKGNPAVYMGKLPLSRTAAMVP